MDVVVVESPAKAKTINRYLGADYTVLASYGHVRDLPSKDGSVRPEESFAMDWEVDSRAEKHIAAITRALKGAAHLYLATDPDREGEAISWHVFEVLRQRHALNDVKVKRVVFHEVTRGAVTEAIRNPRDLDDRLVQAYLARRALDYLVGFTLSPVLWRKIPGSRSAGRVQSVALRLVCEREAEIQAFKPREYWSVEATFLTERQATLTTRLTHLDGIKLEKFSLADEAAAKRAVAAVEAGAFRVSAIERKDVRRHPPPPFITSTLQQEASRKLRFAAKRTMIVAQRLYEGVDVGGETVGLITYMRTDGVQMSNEAIRACRALIGREYGEAYLPVQPRIYRSRAKNAQEAHEAIRPTDLGRHPAQVARYLTAEQRRLYELIWKRAVACQMGSAELEQVGVQVISAEGETGLRATGSVVRFDGFLRLYQEGHDDAPGEDANGGRLLPPVTEGERLARQEVEANQHFTQPPPRYTEASLVHRLEELGIGRPSTYASILSVLQDRDYVRLEKRRFVPEDRGRLVTSFLTHFFERYVQYNFTADLENELDNISGGRAHWKSVLEPFWVDFSKAVGETKGLTISDVINALDVDLGPHFFPAGESESNPRVCPSCDDGRLGLKLGKFGAFIGCSNYPSCTYTRPLTEIAPGEAQAGLEFPRELGLDPASQQTVSVRKGPYGLYVQLGEAAGKQKPKRTSLPRGMAPEGVTLDLALALLALPREVGPHPETGKMITAGIGRFGPYVHHDATYKSLGGGNDVLTVGLNRAVALLAEARKGAGIRALGNHPEDGKPVTLRKGRFGPYVSHGSVRAPLPKGRSMEGFTLEEAIALIEAKAARAKGAKSARKKGAKAGTGRSRKGAGDD